MLNKLYPLSRYKANSGKKKKMLGRYHRDIKILKILVFNSKRFRVYGIFKKLQIDDDKVGLPNTTIS